MLLAVGFHWSRLDHHDFLLDPIFIRTLLTDNRGRQSLRFAAVVRRLPNQQRFKGAIWLFGFGLFITVTPVISLSILRPLRQLESESSSGSREELCHAVHTSFLAKAAPLERMVRSLGPTLSKRALKLLLEVLVHSEAAHDRGAAHEKLNAGLEETRGPLGDGSALLAPLFAISSNDAHAGGEVATVVCSSTKSGGARTISSKFRFTIGKSVAMIVCRFGALFEDVTGRTRRRLKLKRHRKERGNGDNSSSEDTEINHEN